MKVDPEQLEREADELQKQMMEQTADPAPEGEEDTPPVPENDENPPAESADTGEDGDEQTPSDEDRGDPDHDEGDVDLRKQLAIAEERVKNAQARMTKATTEAAELKRTVATLQQTVGDLENQLANAANRQDEVDDELSRLSEEYPDIAQPLLKKLNKLEEEVKQHKSQIATDQSEQTLRVHFDSIRKSHPDMDDLVTSDDFSGWLERQTPLWQRVASQGSAAEVVELLDRYKQAMGAAPQQPVSNVDRARKVAEPSMPKARKPDPNSGKRIWTREEIRRMSLSDFEKHQDAIDKAYLDGRVR